MFRSPDGAWFVDVRWSKVNREEVEVQNRASLCVGHAHLGAPADQHLRLGWHQLEADARPPNPRRLQVSPLRFPLHKLPTLNSGIACRQLAKVSPFLNNSAFRLGIFRVPCTQQRFTALSCSQEVEVSGSELCFPVNIYSLRWLGMVCRSA